MNNSESSGNNADNISAYEEMDSKDIQTRVISKNRQIQQAQEENRGVS